VNAVAGLVTTYQVPKTITGGGGTGSLILQATDFVLSDSVLCPIAKYVMTDSSASPVLTHTCPTPNPSPGCRTVTYSTETVRTSSTSPSFYSFKFDIYMVNDISVGTTVNFIVKIRCSNAVIIN
jgi:hypothetical protein